MKGSRFSTVADLEGSVGRSDAVHGCSLFQPLSGQCGGGLGKHELEETSSAEWDKERDVIH